MSNRIHHSSVCNCHLSRTLNREKDQKVLVGKQSNSQIRVVLFTKKTHGSNLTVIEHEILSCDDDYFGLRFIEDELLLQFTSLTNVYGAMLQVSASIWP